METELNVTAAAPELRVFVVEDSALIRERIDTMVTGITGTQLVGHAEGAEQAVHDILAVRPDVVVLDLKLAQGSGFDVLRALHARAPAIDVYMLSSFPTEPYRRLAERLGARQFFDKTTEFESMRDALAARVATCH